FALRHARPPRPPLFPYTTLFRSTPADTLAELIRNGTSETRELALENPNKETLKLALAKVAEDPNEDVRRAVASSPYAPAEVLAKDRKSTRLNSSHGSISYAVFCF